MQITITPDDICDGIEAHTEETMAVVRSWYYFVRDQEKETKRELRQELRAAIRSVTGLRPDEIIIDLR
jgi:flagellar biosynthesis regulator FlaF